MSEVKTISCLGYKPTAVHKKYSTLYLSDLQLAFHISLNRNSSLSTEYIYKASLKSLKLQPNNNNEAWGKALSYKSWDMLAAWHLLFSKIIFFSFIVELCKVESFHRFLKKNQEVSLIVFWNILQLFPTKISISFCSLKGKNKIPWIIHVDSSSHQSTFLYFLK